jgi:hypothetical protein
MRACSRWGSRWRLQHTPAHGHGQADVLLTILVECKAGRLDACTQQDDVVAVLNPVTCMSHNAHYQAVLVRSACMHRVM